MIADNSEGARNEAVDPDRLAEQEAAAAAAEAAQIGGPAPDEDLDPAERPVVEGGGGVAEGFEQAEADLIRQASHEDEGVPPTADFAGTPEDARATAVYGDADEVEATEVVRDPGEEDDDPGAGPGITTER
jgi:hypothetical protein